MASIQQEYFTAFWRDETVSTSPGEPVTTKDFIIREDGRKITKAYRMNVSDTSLQNISNGLTII